ncbi:MAG: hypothetical protein U0744_16415 [Gemmataceae bacterium]
MDSVQTSRSAPAQPAASTRQMLDELDALMERMLSLPVADTESTVDEPPAMKKPIAAKPPTAPPTPYPTVSAKLTVIESPEGDFGPDSPEPDAREERVTVAFPTPLDLPPIEEEPESPAVSSWFDLPKEEDETPPAQDWPETNESPSTTESAEVPAVEAPTAETPIAESAVAKSPEPELETRVAASWLEKPSGLEWQPPASSSYAEPDSMLAPPLEPIIAPPPSLGIETPTVPKPKLTRVVQSKAGYRPLLRLNRGFDGAMGWLGPIGRSLRGKQGRNLLGITGFGLMLGALLWLVKDWMGWNW